MNAWYQWDNGDLILRLRVQARASRDEFGAVQGDHRRVRITAPPVEGKANNHLCRWLADLFQVPPSRITLLTGAASRDKRLRVGAPRRLVGDIATPPAGDVARAPSAR